MKIRPEILLNTKKEISYKKILVTGSDESLMYYVRDFILSDFKKRNFFTDISGVYNNSVVGSLFSDKKTLFLLTDYIVKDYDISASNSDDHYFLIVSPNGKKTNAIKYTFSKLKDALVVECYMLNNKTKEASLKYFIENNNLSLSYEVFWYIVESFDNNYVIFIKQLEALVLFKKKVDLVSDIEKIIFLENKIELNKIFFKVFTNNKLLSDIFNKSIRSVSDLYIFLNSTKLYLEIISKSSNKENAVAKLPKYLFAEKDSFLKIYSKLNKYKLLKIYSGLSKVEVLIRKHSELYSVIGLRFFLNLKKIIIS